MFRRKEKKPKLRLIHAIRENDVVAAREILVSKKCNVDETDEDLWTPLCWAVFSGLVGLVDDLLEAGATVDVLDKLDRSPLYLAAGWGDSNGKILQKLVAKSILIKYLTRDGMFPLFVACFRGKLEATRILVEAGANLLQCDPNGRTAFQIAKAKGNREIQEVLLDAAKKEFFDAARQGNLASVEGFLKFYSIDVNFKDITGWTALHHAMNANATSVSTFLSRYGAEPELRNSMGMTPIDLARDNDFVMIVSAVKAAHSAFLEEKKERDKYKLQDPLSTTSKSPLTSPLASPKKSTLPPSIFTPEPVRKRDSSRLSSSSLSTTVATPTPASPLTDLGLSKESDATAESVRHGPAVASASIHSRSLLPERKSRADSVSCMIVLSEDLNFELTPVSTTALSSVETSQRNQQTLESSPISLHSPHTSPSSLQKPVPALMSKSEKKTDGGEDEDDEEDDDDDDYDEEAEDEMGNGSRPLRSAASLLAFIQKNTDNDSELVKMANDLVEESLLS